MIEIITMFVLMVVICLILFWLKKTLFLFGFFFKIFMLFLLVCVVGSAIFGYTVFKDVTNFKDNFSNQTSMFVLKDGSNDSSNTFLAGITINLGAKDAKFNQMSEEELLSTEKLYKDGQMSTLEAKYYKVFVVNTKSIDDITLYNITDQNVVLSRDEIKSILLSKHARDDLAEIISNKNGVSKSEILSRLSATDIEVKNYLFSYYLSTIFNPNNMAQGITELKNGNIEVYKDTALFKAIRLVPQSLLNMALKNQTITGIGILNR